MRKHKFRAWNKEKRKMTTYFYITSTGIVKNANIEKHLEDMDVELLEYIGIKDNNNEEIYEGHIVEISHNDTKYVSDIRFLHGSFCVNQYGTYFPMFSLARPGDVISIIGNIYENPELLGDKEK